MTKLAKLLDSMATGKSPTTLASCPACRLLVFFTDRARDPSAGTTLRFYLGVDAEADEIEGQRFANGLGSGRPTLAEMSLSSADHFCLGEP